MARKPQSKPDRTPIEAPSIAPPRPLPRSADGIAPPDRHGPPGPVQKRHGLQRLRAVLNLSDDVPDAQVIEDACDRINDLEERFNARAFTRVEYTAHRW